VSRLDRDAVIRAAIALADERSLEAVGVRQVAERLRVTPMALYRHVGGKDGMLDGVADALYGEIELPRSEHGWWDELELLAHSTRRVLLAHPWAVPLFSRPLAGPHARALGQALQDALRRAGFSARETDELHHQLANLLFALVAPELHGRTNRAAFRRGLDMLHAGLEARLGRHALRSSEPR
jgi:AcrR family transcriptional regulator